MISSAQNTQVKNYNKAESEGKGKTRAGTVYRRGKKDVSRSTG